MAAIPENSQESRLYTIPGTPPNMTFLPKGDPFAPRNSFSMKIDFEKEPELFKVSDTHYAAT
jgi:ABC-type dipeptide/oligopeptide/nickel transport system ATPase component